MKPIKKDYKPIERKEPEKISGKKELVKKELEKKEKEIGPQRVIKTSTPMIILIVTVSALFGLVVYLTTKSIIGAIISGMVFALLFFGSIIVRRRLKLVERIRKMEEAFPDFIALMASNLRAGMTIDRAILLSSRKEFAPLDREILSLGKEIITGKEIDKALIDLARRVNSEEIKKTVFLINSGIKSGGNLSVLLEQISSNMRERGYVKKRAASNVTMYFIFIFFAIAIGAPVLFGFSTSLVDILSDILTNIPTEGFGNVNIPFALTRITISSNFVLYFSLLFLAVSDILASLALGLVSKGEEKEGLRYTLILIVVSVSMFFAARLFISYYFKNFFG